MTDNPITPWQERVLGLLDADLKIAKAALATRELTPEKAKAFVRKSSSVGIIDFNPGSPAYLRDPNDPACHALRLLLLTDDIQETNAHGSNALHLLLGRLWARAEFGMQFPEIAKAMEAYWLDHHRGHGGRKQNDLTRTLQNRVATHPDEDFSAILKFLQSEYAKDCFYSTDTQTVHVCNVEINHGDQLVTYDDRSGATQKIKFGSIRRKLTRIRRKQKNKI
ncbi:MAG: hypothetical protein O2967_21245 [Proteobacteria bacterium]|nr:hypothetical protein [Pseudomonadota bacterium]